MKLFNAILIGLKDIWSHKFRSMLTMLGIVLGVASLVAMAAIVKGMENGMKESLVAIRRASDGHARKAAGVEEAAALGLVVLVSMVGACMGSGVFGVLVPLTLRRFGADPAMASSIFLTTFTDVLGMGLMLFLATSVLL